MKLTAIRPPRLRTAETEAQHRSATWLELFYDLVFVVAVAALGKRLLDDPDWGTFWEYAGYFVPVWWSWASFTFYADRYDTDDLGQRVLAVAQIVAIALMAASISQGESESSWAFAASFLLARLVLLTMYARAQRHVPRTRTLVTGYLRGFSIGGAVWVVSLFVPEPWRFVLWGIALIIDFVTPYVMRREQAKVPLDVSHLPERFGLFTILVLGESIAAVVAGLAGHGWETEMTIGGVLAIITASSLWWLYFDNLEGSVVRRRPEQRKAWKPTVWIYSHLPLAILLVASGIGLEFMVAQENHAAEKWMVSGGVAGALLAMALIHIATERGDVLRDIAQAQVRMVGAALVLLVGVVGLSWDTNVFVAVIAVICAAQVGVDIYREHRDLSKAPAAG